MNELRAYLRQDDPLQRDPELLRPDVERMRRAVLDATTERPARTPMAAVALVTALSSVATAGLWVVRQVPAVSSSGVEFAPQSSEEQGESPRQLQFVTPGGTRVIWFFATIDQ